VKAVLPRRVQHAYKHDKQVALVMHGLTLNSKGRPEYGTDRDIQIWRSDTASQPPRKPRCDAHSRENTDTQEHALHKSKFVHGSQRGQSRSAQGGQGKDR